MTSRDNKAVERFMAGTSNLEAWNFAEGIAKRILQFSEFFDLLRENGSDE